jgi:hypothetical protein
MEYQFQYCCKPKQLFASVPNNVKILSIQMPDRPIYLHNTALPNAQVHRLSPSNLTLAALDVTRPNIVISHLFMTSIDAQDIALLQTPTGFSGIYRVFVENLPSPSLIKNEIKRVAPKLDFTIFK